MPRINLLDWRQERRERRKKNFFAAMGGAVIATAAVVYVGMSSVDSAVAFQSDRNRYLEEQIQIVERQMKEIAELEQTKTRLIARMHVIEELQQSRSQIVHFFDAIVATLPEGVYLTFTDQSGDVTRIEGMADSNGRVSAYLKNLDASPWFDDPRLIVIEAQEASGRRVSQFTLEVKNTTPSADNDTVADGNEEPENAG